MNPFFLEKLYVSGKTQTLNKLIFHSPLIQQQYSKINRRKKEETTILFFEVRDFIKQLENAACSL